MSLRNKASVVEVLFIIIPAYNEQDNIEQCVSDWYPIVEHQREAKLIIINDGSRDQTLECLKKLAQTRPALLPLTKSNSGHGSTVLYGYRYAIRQGADWVFQTDSDGQTKPSEFAEFWKRRHEYDAIIGNRVVRGDGKARKFIENVVCFLLRVIFRVNVSDANAPFRLMKAELLKKYIDKLPEDFNLPNIMFTTYFVYFKEKVLFLPITFESRKKGVNSINLKKIIKIGWKAMFDFMKLRRKIDV